MINVNQLDDDFNNRALSSLNQRQNVLPIGTKVPLSVSSINSGTGTIANPGPTGFGGNDRPGRRTYNPLSKLSSYTYNVTLYMITPDAYQTFIESGRRNINVSGSFSLNNGNSANIGKITTPGAYIVAQSGGINNTTSKRAVGDRDFYIDNLRFQTSTNTKTTGTSTGATANFEFQITEPYGFSFVTELGKANLAMQQYIGQLSGTGVEAGPKSPWKHFFILGIRFYGYDKDGNVVKPDSQLFGEIIDPIGTGGELFENYYDIQISDLKFKLDGKTVVYSIKAAGINGQTLLGIKRGRVTTGANVTGATVKDCLYGENGLLTLLNKQQETFVNKDPKNLTYPNKFRVTWLGNSESLIGNAKVVTQSDLDKWRWGGTNASSTAQATDSTSNTPPDNNSRQFTFDSDTSIISCIEQIVKKSEFMENALQSLYSNAKEPDYKQKNNEQVKNIGATTFSWFTVSAEIAKATWDDKIKDWCYEINYVIQTYDVPSMESSYVKTPGVYYGAHKRYDYWFTGKNSEVLDFSLNFDTLYFNASLGIENQNIADQSSSSDPGAQREGQNNNSTNQNNSGSSTGNTATTAGNTGLKADSPVTTNGDNSAGTATGGGIVSVVPGQRSGGDKTGNLGVTAEAQNSALTYLNDPGAYAGGTIKILGDPDFLVRDTASSVQELYNKFYDTDGYTISAQGGQVFIEVALREAVDYNNENGLMDLNENILFMNYPPYIKEMSKGAIIYMVSDVMSTFVGGKFEQVLTLVQPTFAGSGVETGPIQTKNPPEVTGDTGLSANDDANKPTTPFEQQLANARPNVPTPLPPPKMSASVLGSSTANILNNTDNFGRPTTINTFGQ